MPETWRIAGKSRSSRKRSYDSQLSQRFVTVHLPSTSPTQWKINPAGGSSSMPIAARTPSYMVVPTPSGKSVVRIATATGLPPRLLDRKQRIAARAPRATRKGDPPRSVILDTRDERSESTGARGRRRPDRVLLAAELERRGVPCVLVDALDAPRAWDRATVVHARSMEIFEALGLEDRLLAEGVRTRAARFQSDGKVLGELNFGASGSRYGFDIGLSEE